MNTKNYKLTNNNQNLNEKAKKLVTKIAFLSNERVKHNHFPSLSNIEYGEKEERKLIVKIVELENIYEIANKLGGLHHKAHLYVLGEDCKVYHNDTEYGSDINTSAAICGGKNEISALKNAWRKWSIPSVLILNNEGISIQEIIDEE